MDADLTRSASLHIKSRPIRNCAAAMQRNRSPGFRLRMGGVHDGCTIARGEPSEIACGSFVGSSGLH